MGLSFVRDLNLYQINRSTYDILNFLGDIGGLLDILTIIGFSFVGSIQTYNLNSYLIRHLFHERRSEKPRLQMSAKEIKALDNPILLQSIRQKLAISFHGISKLYTPLFLELLYWALCCRWKDIRRLRGQYKKGNA
jgi:hypothetical protein